MSSMHSSHAGWPGSEVGPRPPKSRNTDGKSALVRIVSLLPSLTELVCALGHAGDLVGVTHECDYPPGVEQLPHLTRSGLGPSASSAEIDAAVAERGGSLYALDGERLGRLAPDLIL